MMESSVCEFHMSDGLNYLIKKKINGVDIKHYIYN